MKTHYTFRSTQRLDKHRTNELDHGLKTGEQRTTTV